MTLIEFLQDILEEEELKLLGEEPAFAFLLEELKEHEE